MSGRGNASYTLQVRHWINISILDQKIMYFYFNKFPLKSLFYQINIKIQIWFLKKIRIFNTFEIEEKTLKSNILLENDVKILRGNNI